MHIWRVDIIESERGWGQRVDESIYYREEHGEAARDFVKKYNSHNTASSAPDWYMRADNPVLVEMTKPESSYKWGKV